MRLWHKDLIDVLPSKQLVSQWRECCAIAAKIEKCGTPNHLLVNKVMEYDILDFVLYTVLVKREMAIRGYKADVEKFMKHFSDEVIDEAYHAFETCDGLDNSSKIIFSGWHNKRYLSQCFYNLQEKYDCGGVSLDDFVSVKMKYDLLMKN